eukprot:2798410-Amphidinium_carterae.1
MTNEWEGTKLFGPTLDSGGCGNYAGIGPASFALDGRHIRLPKTSCSKIMFVCGPNTSPVSLFWDGLCGCGLCVRSTSYLVRYGITRLRWRPAASPGSF